MSARTRLIPCTPQTFVIIILEGSSSPHRSGTPGTFCVVPVGPRFVICSACLQMHTLAGRLWAFVKPCQVRTNPGWVRLTSCQAWRLRGSSCPSFQTVFNSNLSNKFVLGTVALLTLLNTSSRLPNVLAPSGRSLYPTPVLSHIVVP